MRAMAAGVPAVWGRRPPLLLFLLLGSAAPGAPSPTCHTDFASALVCSWEAGARADCAGDFRLLHRTEPSQEQEACVPEREGARGPPLWCSCTLPRENFRLVSFHLELQRRESGSWRRVWNDTLAAEDMVKPRPLVNLTVEKADRSFILSWTWDYPPSSRLMGAKALYHVAYWPKGQKGEERNITTHMPNYKILADHLMSSSDYYAVVQFKLEQWGDIWSEWSVPVEWHNDFDTRVEAWKLMLWSCIPLVAMILMCYLSFTRIKRDWWDRIPSPAKSKMAQSMMTFPHMKRILCEGKILPSGPKKGNVKDSSSKTAVAATLFGPPVLQTAHGGSGGNPRPKPEVFLTPELVVVECPLVISCRTADAKPVGQKEEGEDELVPRQELVAGLFQDLLNGDFSTGDARVVEAPAAKDQETPGGSVGLALERVLGVPSLPLELLLESGYRNAFAEPEVPPLLGSPAGPEQQPGLQGSASLSWQPGSPLLPRRLAGSSGADRFCPWLDERAAGSIPTLGYRSISTLVPQPVAAPSHRGEAEATLQDLPHSGQIQPPCSLPSEELQSSLLAGTGEFWLSTAALGGSPECPTWGSPGKPGDFSCSAAALLSGYRSFASALQDSSSARDGHGGGSSDAPALPAPYKPLPSFLWNSSGPVPLDESRGAESLAWPENPCLVLGEGGGAGGGGEGQL